MNNKHDTLDKAICIASCAHCGQTNKDGTPYILHPLRLMMKAETPEEKTVAVLHDVLEDCPDYQQATSRILNGYLHSALLSVTKREGEDYEDFIKRCGANAIGRKVKLLDLYDNIDLTRLTEVGEWELKRTLKYHKAIMWLRGLEKTAGV